jgi:DNA polymerase III epsilon subunit-like protein
VVLLVIIINKEAKIMLVVLKGMKHKYVMVADVEYDYARVLQFAAIVLERTDEPGDVYRYDSSINSYITQKYLSRRAEQYTGITLDKLKDWGQPMEDFIEFYNLFYKDLDMEQTVFVSHGAKNDRKVLREAGLVNLPAHSYCTYKNGRTALKREKTLRLTDLAEESGYSMDNAHDAFADARATLHVLSYVLSLKED